MGTFPNMELTGFKTGVFLEAINSLEEIPIIAAFGVFDWSDEARWLVRLN